MPDKSDEIRVNRAPVLTLWASVVAEHLGHDADAAITLGRAVAGSSARVKARSIGLEEKHPDRAEHDAAKPAISTVPRQTVRLLGRDILVIEHNGSQFALEGEKPASPSRAHAYVEKALGRRRGAVRRAMDALARSLPPEELNRVAFRLYEQFRPEVPAGVKGWGAKGILDLSRIENAH